MHVYIYIYVCICMGVCEIKEEKLTKKTTVNVNWCANVCSQLRSNFDRMQTHIYFFFCVFFLFFLHLHSLSVLLLATDCNKPCGYDVRCETMCFSIFFIIEEKEKRKKQKTRESEWIKEGEKKKLESNIGRMSSAFWFNLNHKFDFLTKDNLK